MMFPSPQIKDVLSGGKVVVLRYIRAITDGSELKSSSHTFGHIMKRKW